MQKYMKQDRSVLVEAMQLDEDNVDKISNWTQSQIVEEKNPITNEVSEGLNIKTPDGKRRASRGDYVIKHGTNFYVMAASRFETLYHHAFLEDKQKKEPLDVVRDPVNGMTRFGEGPRP